MTLGQGNDSPLAVPRPASSTGIAATALGLLEFLVFAGRETDNNIRLAGSQGHDVDAGRGAQGAKSLRVRSGRVPEGL